MKRPSSKSHRLFRYWAVPTSLTLQPFLFSDFLAVSVVTILLGGNFGPGKKKKSADTLLTPHPPHPGDPPPPGIFNENHPPPPPAPRTPPFPSPKQKIIKNTRNGPPSFLAFLVRFSSLFPGLSWQVLSWGPSGDRIARVCLPHGSRPMRAKGTLISEPRFSTPARCDLSHARKGKWPLQRETLDKGHFPFLAWEKSHLAGGRKSGLTN